jgi:pilus assembly protein Flp/PilA
MTISSLKASIRRLTTDEDGVTAVEYGVIGALIIVACVTIIGGVGTNLGGAMTAIKNALAPAAP